MVSLIICAGLLSAIAFDVAQCKSVSTESPQIPDGLTIHKVIATWEEAHLRCQNEGAVLASPIDEHLLNVMKSLIGVNNTPYFIGTKASNSSGPFVSEGGVPLLYMTAAVIEMVDQLDPCDGRCLSMDQDHIREVSCCERLPFMCYKADVENNAKKEYKTKMRKNIKLECSPGYTLESSTSKCYKMHDEKKEWDDAEATCLAEGGHLAIVDDENEAEVLRQLILTDVHRIYAYVGIRDRTADGYRGTDWRSIHGDRVEELFNEWATSRMPTLTPLKCGALLYSGRLYNYYCNTQMEFICEQEPVNG